MAAEPSTSRRYLSGYLPHFRYCFHLVQANTGTSFAASLQAGSLSWDNQCRSTALQTPFVLTVANGSFSWKSVRPKQQVTNYSALPLKKPLQLPRIQHKFSRFPKRSRAIRLSRRDFVRQTFLKGWTSYRKYAWGHDEPSPISAGYKDTYGGWGATLVDNLDTLLIMGFNQEYEEAASAATQISFTPRGFIGTEVNVFETIIRYLGGFLSAYDMAGCMDKGMLTKAVEVADLAYAAFDTPNRMLVSRWNIQKYDQEQEASHFASLTELASFSLEFTRLSMLTGDMKYFDAAERVKDLLDQQQNQTRLPGLFPESVDLQRADFRHGAVFTLGANADSAYEYFAKTYQLLGGHGAVYRKLYEQSMDAATDKLIFKPKTHDNADILVRETGMRATTAASLKREAST
jgi:mannosyl-oligosaccharide alpha-1,2-mannosidase